MQKKVATKSIDLNGKLIVDSINFNYNDYRREVFEIKNNFFKDNKNIIIAGLIIIIVVFRFLNYNKENKKEPISTKNDVKLKIRESEINKLSLEDYENDVFTMKKPKGWSVDAAGSGIYYAIRVYDPNNSINQVFLMLKMQPLLKSEAGKAKWQEYYKLAGSDPKYKVFADAVVLDNPTTEGFYQKFNDISAYMNNIEPTLSAFKFPAFNNFSKQEEFESNASMKSVSLDSKTLRATFSDNNGTNGEGLFMASIVNFGNQTQGGTDMLYYMVYDIAAVTSVNNEFINYKDILLDSLKTIDFKSEYVKKTIDDGNAQTKQALALSASVQKAFDSYMSAWENRQKTYDIISQKQSDATLGYERVYDTTNGDIYKAYNGFTDDYDGERYKSVTDEMYTNKINGYIEK